MRQWTEQQQRVIDSPCRKIICSAAAGSGKTAVMIERVIRMLREGARPESFLVMTFTNAAASEMKEKIRVRLREGRSEKTLRTAYEKIDLMEISTIHSFCQHLIRQEFQAVEVDPFFAVCDQARSARLFSLSFRAACTDLQKGGDPDYTYWKRVYNRKDTEEMVRSTYDYMMSLPDPFGWLERSCEEIPLTIDPDHPWFAAASRIVEEHLLRAMMILNRQFRMFEEPEHVEAFRKVWKADRELFHVKQLWAEGAEVPAEALQEGFMRQPGVRGLNSLEQDWKDRYAALREELKQLAAKADLFIRPDPAKVADEFGNMKRSLQGLLKLVRLTAEEYAKRKASQRLLDFSDMEHYALKILSAEPSRSAVRSRFTEIFVDECQDVSRVQDEIIQNLFGGEGHLFMVGDVKQSIYRFRLADPGLFLRRMREYRQPDSDGECLELQTNFRSRPEILETTNLVFRDIMRESVAELDYTDRDALLPGRPPLGRMPVYADRLVLDGEVPRLTALADHMVCRLRELKQEGYKYRDVVILMPQVSTDGKKLQDLLRKRDIPVFFDGVADFYELDEIRIFLHLLSWVDSPYQDEDLIVVLRNAPFFMSEEELAQIRLCNMGQDVPFREAFRDCCRRDTKTGARCREAEEKIADWRKRAEFMPMSTFVRYLCSASHQLAMAGVTSMGNTAKRNLRLLCRQAEQAEKAGVYTLSGFLSFVSEQAGGGDQRAASPLAEGDDVVRIMTMHKSKGLQFPVVFCLGLERETGSRKDSKIALDADLGICLRYKDPEHRVSRDTAAGEIFAWKKEREERAERIRLLYVAMTRAQERMFLVAAEKAGKERAVLSAPPGEHRVLSAGDYMDWILPALQDGEKLSTGYAQAEKPYEIRVFSSSEQKIVEKPMDKAKVEEWLDSLLSSPFVEEMWINDHPERALSKMIKRSVTSLLKNAETEIFGSLTEDGEDEETPEEKRIPERFSAALRRSARGRQPDFVRPTEENMGAWRGTVIHRFLSLMDLDEVRPEENRTAVLLDMRQRMMLDGIFTEEEAAVISPEAVDSWLRSGLGRRMLSSGEVHREWGFNLYRPERDLLVQGVIDCAFREGDGWIIVDYKTDRVEDGEAFMATYRPQLAWYAEALRDLTGKPVKETWLYALSRQEAYRVH